MTQDHRNATATAANDECGWLQTSMEALFAEELPDRERRRAEQHIAECSDCRSEVEALRGIDPMMRNLLEFRTALATQSVPRRIHFGRIFAATAAAAAAAAVILTLWSPARPAPVNSVAHDTPAAIDKAPLGPEAPERERTAPKPLAPQPAPPVNAGTTTVVPGPSAPHFAVVDIAGYERTLADFRGQTLLIGVLSPNQPQAAENLERVNRSVGTRLRLLAVANDRRMRTPKNATFQILYNNGSKLLGAQESEYLLVNSAGDVIERGSLLGDSGAIVNTVRGTLKKLETR